MLDDQRYTELRQVLPDPLPAITKKEAERAAKALYKTYGGKKWGTPHQHYAVKFTRVPSTWVSQMPSYYAHRGWGRLIHDVSHTIFRYRHPGFRPHHNLHSRLEIQIARHVVKSGWLDGRLRDQSKEPPSPEMMLHDKIEHTEHLLKGWRTKMKRANRAIAKLERRRVMLHRCLKERGKMVFTNG